MRIFRFDREVGKVITAYESRNLMITPLFRGRTDAFIGCMHVGADGVVGYHQATMPQLFLVVQGSGWVRGKESNRVAITAGQAAYWEQGEWHEASSDLGMTAIVMESISLEPGVFLQLIESEESER